MFTVECDSAADIDDQIICDDFPVRLYKKASRHIVFNIDYTSCFSKQTWTRFVNTKPRDIEIMGFFIIWSKRTTKYLPTVKDTSAFTPVNCTLSYFLCNKTRRYIPTDDAVARKLFQNHICKLWLGYCFFYRLVFIWISSLKHLTKKKPTMTASLGRAEETSLHQNFSIKLHGGTLLKFLYYFLQKKR